MSSNQVSVLRRRLPALLPTLRPWSQINLRSEAIAAVTVVAVLIPSGLAYGELAGLSPVSGLYTAVWGMAGYALFASSRVMIVGPESQMAILVAAAVAPMGAANPEEYAGYAALVALIAAGICLVAALLRLGFLADYLSQPVLVGYLTGVGLIIIVSQLAKIIGARTSGSTLLDLTTGLWANRAEADVASALVGAISLALVVGVRRLHQPKLPASLVVVVVMTAASAALGFADRGVAVVGDVPRGLPLPTLPPLTGVVQLLLPALGITLIVFANTVLTGRAYANRDGTYRIDANAELLALASANFGAGIGSGFAIGASDSRTAVNQDAHGRSQLVGLLAAAMTIVFLLLLTPLVADLPLPTLAAVVIVAASALLRPGDYRELWRFRRFEFVLAVTTLVGVAVLGILPGILLAVAVNLLDLVAQLANPSTVILGPVEDSTRWRSVSREEAARAEPGILVMRFGGPLFFASADRLTSRVNHEIAARGPQLRWFVLDCEAITMIDSNGAMALRSLLDSAQDKGIVFALARTTKALEGSLDRAGVLASFQGHLHDRVADAVDEFRAQH